MFRKAARSCVFLVSAGDLPLKAAASSAPLGGAARFAKDGPFFQAFLALAALPGVHDTILQKGGTPEDGFGSAAGVASETRWAWQQTEQSRCKVVLEA